MPARAPTIHRKGRLFVWRATDNLWWWALKAANGRTLVSADAGKSSKRNAVVNAKAAINLIREHSYVLVDEDGREMELDAA